MKIPFHMQKKKATNLFLAVKYLPGSK